MAQVVLNSLLNRTETAGNIFQKVSNKESPRDREEKIKKERAGDLGLGAAPCGGLRHLVLSLGDHT